ncbi:MAG: hypothetical protein ACOC1F_10715 [Myxococcota bacterium]
MRIDDDVVVFDGRRPYSEQNVKNIARYPDELGRAFWPFDWSPDGKTLAGFTSPPDSKVVLLSIESQTYRVMAEGLQPRWLPVRGWYSAMPAGSS